MEKGQRLHYTRLWKGGNNSRERPSSPREKRKTGGVSSFSKAASTGAHSNNAIARQKHWKSCNAQSAHSNYRRAVSPAGLTRNQHPSSAPPPRSHSSLGFRELRTLRETPQSHPQGFDLQGYIKQHGSANDIRIGINGWCSPDEYFERYLDECGAVAQCEKKSTSSTSFTNDMEELDLTERATSPSQMATPHTQLPLVPLCWEDQLKKAKVNGLIHVD